MPHIRLNDVLESPYRAAGAYVQNRARCAANQRKCALGQRIAHSWQTLGVRVIQAEHVPAPRAAHYGTVVRPDVNHLHVVGEVRQDLVVAAERHLFAAIIRQAQRVIPMQTRRTECSVPPFPEDEHLHHRSRVAAGSA